MVSQTETETQMRNVHTLLANADTVGELMAAKASVEQRLRSHMLATAEATLDSLATERTRRVYGPVGVGRVVGRGRTYSSSTAW